MHVDAGICLDWKALRGTRTDTDGRLVQICPFGLYVSVDIYVTYV